MSHCAECKLRHGAQVLLPETRVGGNVKYEGARLCTARAGLRNRLRVVVYTGQSNVMTLYVMCPKNNLQ